MASGAVSAQSAQSPHARRDDIRHDSSPLQFSEIRYSRANDLSFNEQELRHFDDADLSLAVESSDTHDHKQNSSRETHTDDSMVSPQDHSETAASRHAKSYASPSMTRSLHNSNAPRDNEADRDYSHFDSETVDPGRTFHSASSPAAAAARRTRSRTSAREPSGVGSITHPRSPSSEHSHSGEVPEQIALSESSTASSATHASGIHRPLTLQAQHHDQSSYQSKQSDDTLTFTDNSSTLQEDSGQHIVGAVPMTDIKSNRPLLMPVRMPSLASIASDLSAHSASALSDTAQADDVRPSSENAPAARTAIETYSPSTPRAGPSNFSATTDTVIAQHVRNIQVPATIAQEYRLRHPQNAVSPEKLGLAAPVVMNGRSRAQSSLTLKEQNSKIDKLTKENFDLKLKIHFLDQALQVRSDEGVKNMINQNVQLQTDLIKERKDSQALRRSLRDLERQLGEARDALAAAQRDIEHARFTSHQESETVISELREQMDRSQVRITQLAAENIACEMQKRKLEDYVSTMTARRGSEESAVQESAAMWKEMLATENSRREQAEHDLRQLREELITMRSERRHKDRLSGLVSERRNNSRLSQDMQDDRPGAESRASSTLVDNLRHENMELRRDLSAQTSMLTSRNKERERLQQEIEDLKIAQRRLDSRHSMSGDSGFDRTTYRDLHRSPSRGHGLGLVSRMSSGEREEYGLRENDLRDKNAHLSLQLQALDDEHKHIQTELDAAVQDLCDVQAERDEALHALEARDHEYEKLDDEYKALIEEATTKIETLEENLTEAENARRQSRVQLEHKEEDFEALQQELKNISTKHQKSEVQQESLQNEIAFLREEQEGDKIKLGDLEHNLQIAHDAIQTEIEKVQTLETRLHDERVAFEGEMQQHLQDHQVNTDELFALNDELKKDIDERKQKMATSDEELAACKRLLQDLEGELKRALGSDDSSHAGFVQQIMRMQQDMDQTVRSLQAAKSSSLEKDRMIKARDAMLESTGLEGRHLSDLLDKERKARKEDLHQFELANRGSTTQMRIIAQHEAKVSELETARSQDRRKATALEQQYREQVDQRNNLLLALDDKLSALCGRDWAQTRQRPDLRVTNIDTISRSLPAVQQNINEVMSRIETVMGGFKKQIRATEKRLDNDCAALERQVAIKTERLTQVEQAMEDMHNKDVDRQEMRSPSPGTRIDSADTDELARLRQDNQNLRAELGFHRQYPSDTARSKMAQESTGGKRNSTTSFAGLTTSPRAFAKAIWRHNSVPGFDSPQQSSELSVDGASQDDVQTLTASAPPLQSGDARWAHRYKEIEKRLKAEREGRLLDRRGARQRLDAGEAENAELRAKLKRLSDAKGALDSAKPLHAPAIEATASGA